MEAIASQRAVQLSTVQSYIAEAMAAGYSYPWHRMRLPFSILASLCGHVCAYHKQQLLADARQLLKQQESNAGGLKQGSQQHQTAPGEAHQGVEVQPVSPPGCHRVGIWAGGLHQGGQQQHQHSSQHEHHRQPLPGQHSQCCRQGGLLPEHQAAAAALQSKPAVMGDMFATDITKVCSHCGLSQGCESLMLHPDGQVFPSGDSITRLAAAQAQSQQPVQLPDMQLVRGLAMTSRGTKAIRDSMDTSVLSYGPMRLALAHIYCLLRHHICSCLQTDLCR